MALFTRITRLFRADVHYLLDCIEDPEAMLKQALREMEDEIARDEKAMAENSSREAQLKRECEDCSLNIQQVLKNIDDSLAANEERLARAFVKRKLESERRLVEISNERTARAAEETRLQQRLSLRREKLSEISKKAKLFEEARRIEKRKRDNLLRFTNPAGAVTEEEVELALLQARKKYNAEAHT